jgi:hypothetical protein
VRVDSLVSSFDNGAHMKLSVSSLKSSVKLGAYLSFLLSHFESFCDVAFVLTI